MTSEPRDAPYPELKKTHTMASKGRPWTDHKPPPAAPVWAAIEGLGHYYILVAALELNVFDTLKESGPSTAEVLAENSMCLLVILRLCSTVWSLWGCSTNSWTFTN